MMSLDYHCINSIKLGEVKYFEATPNLGEFWTRSVEINMDGQSATVGLFSRVSAEALEVREEP